MGPPPAPSKYAVDRRRVALAPWGSSWPNAPHPLGRISGALDNPESGLPSSMVTAAPTPRPALPNSEPRPRTGRPIASAPSTRPAVTPQKFWSIEPKSSKPKDFVIKRKLFSRKVDGHWYRLRRR